VFIIFSLVHSGLIESKEKREQDNQIIKTIPPIPEAGLLALNVVLNNNTANKEIDNKNQNNNDKKQ
jgi:hypothetical protein